MNAPVIDRRRVLAGGGALIVSFSLTSAYAEDPVPAPAAPPPKLPGSLNDAPLLDAWIRIDADGAVTAFTGKVELGQGFKTAFQQIAAEEMDVPFASLTVITADTGRTANEGYTSGSHSMQDSGTAIQNAAAQARALLVAEAARRFEVPEESLHTENGAVISFDGRRLGYGELVAGDLLHVQAQPKSKLKDPATFKVMGQPVPRLDIPAKVTGGVAYVQDMRLPGMVHARIVRPPSYGAQLTACDIVRDRKNARASSRWCATAISSRWSPARNSRRSRRCACCRRPRNGKRRPLCRSRTICFAFSPICRRRIRRSSSTTIPPPSAPKPSRPPIRGRISRMVRSARPARSRNPPMAS